jgi:hypothetical protein
MAEWERFPLPSLAWVVSLVGSGRLWGCIVRSIPREGSRLVRLALLLSYVGFFFLSIFCFALTLRFFPYADFGFYFSMALPTVVFWVAAVVFAVGVLSTAVILFPSNQKRYRARSALRAFWRYTVALLPMHFAFAAAYSSLWGIAAAAGVALLVWYQHSVLPEKRKEKQPRAKWE